MPCAFCGEPFQKPHRPRSEEHALAKWLGDFFPNEGEDFRHSLHHGTTGELLHSWTNPELDIVASKVCEPCNTGWMERSESAARPYLASLMQGRGRRITPEGQPALAAWAMKTALALHLATPDAAPIPESHYRGLTKNETHPPDNVQVSIAALDDHRASHAHSKPRTLTMTDSSGAEFDAYVVTFFVRHAIFQVFGHTYHEPVTLTKGGAWAHATAQIWPVLGPVDFPPRLVLDLGGFARFARPPEPKAP